MPLKYICLFASFVVIQADLKNYLALIHHGQDSEHLRQNLVKPSENNLGGFSNEDSNNLNSVGDDRIPFDINGRKPEAKEVGHDTQISYENLALEVVKDVLLNHPNAQFDFQECLNAMANIVEEERLVRTIKNLTMDAVSIISNASAMIVECQEKNSFSTCLVTAVNELGAAFIGVSEDIERAVMATMVLTQKLYEQIKLCIGQNDLPISTIVTSLLRMTHASDSTHLKDNASNEIPRVPQEPSESQAHKWYPFLREHRQFNNL